MRTVILGAGPAGLYLAYLIRRRNPTADVHVIEQNPPDATFGFGVVFSERALEFLNADDPETLAAILPHLVGWRDMTLDLNGETVRVDGVGFTAIGRLDLLQILQHRLAEVGITPEYNHAVTSVHDLGEADLVVGADGVNSLVRRAYEFEFGTTTQMMSNRFAWFGTHQLFDTLTQTFRETDQGYFNAHHYRYSEDMSTFIVEVDEETFFRVGFDKMDEDASARLCQDIFSDTLGGKPLLINKSMWRQFPKVWNEHWYHGRNVLVGDALRTAHFSIGSGTRLAWEDVIALDKALAAHGDDVPAALKAYEASRRPIVEKLVTAANASIDWYERFPENMKLQPLEFALSYMRRSERVSLDELRRSSPRFIAAVEAARAA
jgi:2-polyprenyl-6-methoxyphenol hydroxylase-like FAD-dependent oxidoreductase